MRKRLLEEIRHSLSLPRRTTSSARNHERLTVPTTAHSAPKIEATFDYLKEHMHLVSSFLEV